MHACMLRPFSHVRFFVTPWTAAPPGSSVHGILQARILDGVAVPPPGDLPYPGFKHASPALQADSLQLSHQGSPPQNIHNK